MLKQGTISIHTENIFPIIKKSLPDHEIFYGSDLKRCRYDPKAGIDKGEYNGDIGEPKIQLRSTRTGSLHFRQWDPVTAE